MKLKIVQKAPKINQNFIAKHPRRPFFLLEILIAIILISFFTYLSIHSAFRVIRQQQKYLATIEETLAFDRRYMKTIAESCKNLKLLLEKEQIINGFKVSVQIDKDNKHYLIKCVDNKKEYFYLL